jgi:hypothetical protein
MNYHFREREAQLYLKKGEMQKLLSPADRAVLKALEGKRLGGPAITRATGLSRMAILLASYRLTGLGLIAQFDKPRKRRSK